MCGRVLERETDNFNKFVKAEKERVEKETETEIEKETSDFQESKQRRLADMKIKHTEMSEIKRSQQELAANNMAEKHRREKAELERKNREKLEVLGNTQATQRKELLAIATREKDNLASQSGDELKGDFLLSFYFYYYLISLTPFSFVCPSRQKSRSNIPGSRKPSKRFSRKNRKIG